MNGKESKTALITGANRGIGLAIARGLLQKGYEVIITSRSFDKATEAVKKLETLGQVIAIELDVSDDRSIDRAFETINQKSIA